MSWYDDAWDATKRGAEDYATGGYSELYDWGKGSGLFSDGKNHDSALGQYQNANWLRQQSRQGMLDAQGRQAPQAGYTQMGPAAQSGYTQLMGGPQDQFRAQQMQAANQLGGVANGSVMGAGQMAARQEGNRAIAQQRGGNAAIAARGAAMNTGNIGLNTAGQAAQAQRTDAMQAQQARAGILDQGRTQDIGFAGQNAQLQQQTNLANMDAQNQHIFQQAGLNQATSLANMQARLTTMGMNDQMAQAYLQQLYGIDNAELQARLAREGITAAGITPGDVMQVGGTVAAGAIASDRALKKDVRKASSSIDEMLDKLEATVYRYKDEKHGEGRRAGIMAQDLQRSKLGALVVRETPGGKMLDVNAAVSAALASSARLHRRLSDLERKK